MVAKPPIARLNISKEDQNQIFGNGANGYYGIPPRKQSPSRNYQMGQPLGDRKRKRPKSNSILGSWASKLHIPILRHRRRIPRLHLFKLECQGANCIEPICNQWVYKAVSEQFRDSLDPQEMFLQTLDFRPPCLFLRFKCLEAGSPEENKF